MKSQNILKEISVLIKTGKCDQAIEMLEEAIKNDAENPRLYASLGRVYQSLKKPQQAVQHLKYSLELFKLENIGSKKLEKVSGNDFEYIEQRNEEFIEDDFELSRFSFPKKESACKPTQQILDKLDDVVRHTDKPEITFSEADRKEVIRRPKKSQSTIIKKQIDFLTEPNADDKEISSASTYLKEIDKVRRPILSLKKTSKSIENNNPKTDASDGDTLAEKTVILIKKGRDLFSLKNNTCPSSSLNQTVNRANNPPSLKTKTDNKQSNNSPLPGKKTLPDAEECDSNNQEDIDGFIDEDEANYLASESSVEQEWEDIDKPLEYEFSEEDYYEDFNTEFIESFEVLLQSEEEQQDDEDNDTRISPWQKAEKVAADFILYADWHEKHLDFMTNIFCTNGYGATRKALQYLLERNMTFEELYLAYCVREYWQQNESYWITFNGIGAFNRFTSPLYSQLSWRQALSIVRYFTELPEPEEIEFFLEEEFSYWFNHSALRRTHPVFIKYLAYRKPNALQPGMVNYGDREADGYITYDPLEDDYWNAPQSDEVQLLSRLGVNLY